MESKDKVGRKKKKTALWILLGLFLIIGIVIALVYIKLGSLNKTVAEFIEKPDIILETAADLPPIVGTPADIDEDYLVPVETIVEEAIYKQVPIDESVYNVLLLGSDVRPDEGGNGRSDSMMLVTIDRKSGGIKITSFMRDTWISIPNKGWNRINAAYAFGGIGLAINTVNENFGLDIQNYAVIEFSGLENVVDNLGGVEVVLTKKEITIINNANPGNPLPEVAGTYVLDGAQTLTHCRNRKTGDGDFGRTRRQREVMVSIVSKLKSTMDPIKLTSFLTETLKYVDTNIAPNTIFTLGLELLGSKENKLEQARVPFDGTWQYANKGGRSVVTINLSKNKELLHDFLYQAKE